MKVILLFLLSAFILNAEINYDIHASFSSEIIWKDGKLFCCSDVLSTGPRFPIVVTVTDETDKPIKGAVAAIKRIQPGGYTEADVKKTKNSLTDKDGRITLYCPRKTDRSDPKKPKLQILGAISVVAEGYQTTVIDFEQYFAGMELVSDERTALAAHIVLKKMAK